MTKGDLWKRGLIWLMAPGGQEPMRQSGGMASSNRHGAETGSKSSSLEPQHKAAGVTGNGGALISKPPLATQLLQEACNTQTSLHSATNWQTGGQIPGALGASLTETTTVLLKARFPGSAPRGENQHQH